MNNQSTPTNINNARRLANSWEKARHLVAEGYLFIRCTLADSPVTLVAIYKPGDAANAPSYWIHEGFSVPEIKNGCNCPDFQRNGAFCKHTLAWDDIQQTEAAIAQFEAEYKLIEYAECAAGVDFLL